MLRPLSFITVREKNDNAAQQSPLVLARRDELVDDDLRTVGKIAELRLPHHQRFGIIAAVAVLKAEHSSLREDRVIHLKLRLIIRKIIQRNQRLFILDIDQHTMSLIEGAALAVLSAQAHRRSLHQQRANGNSFSHSVIKWLLALPHLLALFEQLLDLRMNVKTRRILREARSNLADFLRRQASLYFVFRLVLSASVCRPVIRQR